MTNPLDRQQLEQYASKTRPDFAATLRTFFDIPSVSMDPAHARPTWCVWPIWVLPLERLGARARNIRAAGNQIVHEHQFPVGAGLPSVTVYNHFDVQPADDAEEAGDPFRMVERHGR